MATADDTDAFLEANLEHSTLQLQLDRARRQNRRAALRKSKLEQTVQRELPLPENEQEKLRKDTRAMLATRLQHLRAREHALLSANPVVAEKLATDHIPTEQELDDERTSVAEVVDTAQALDKELETLMAESTALDERVTKLANALAEQL